jgi:hypothetical protein
MNFVNSINMFRKTKCILVLILALIFYNSSAQNNQVLYYMNLPQKHLLNPAARPSNSLYIGLPAISGINLNINNNFVNFSDVFIKGAGDSILSFLHPDYDVAKFMAKIRDKNSIEPEVLVQLFGLGFNVGRKSYVFLDINERADGNIVLPGDLFKLGFEGNEQFVGSSIDLSSLRGDVKIYHEVGLGFSRDFTSKLRIGIKGKLLMGIAAASIDNKSLSLAVNDDYTHTLNADLVVNFSAPVSVYISSDNKIDSLTFDDSVFNSGKTTIDYLLKSKNIGLGLDIGAEYKFNEKLEVSAAITDIGYINWKRDISNLKANSQFDFSGVDLLDVYNGTMTFDSLGQELLDSLKNSFTLTNEKMPFTTYLPFGVTLGGSYNLTKNISVGILSYSRFIGKQIREALTLSANLNVSNAFSTSIAYTAANNRYDNLGFGLAFRTGWAQFYFIADRIPITWNKIISDGNTIPIPYSWNTIHAMVGMNLAFGNKIKKKNDKPMLLVQ